MAFLGLKERIELIKLSLRSQKATGDHTGVGLNNTTEEYAGSVLKADEKPLNGGAGNRGHRGWVQAGVDEFSIENAPLSSDDTDTTKP